MSDDAWPPDAVDQLTRLWTQETPRLSAAEIGRVMRRTKNEIVGKARRLSLPARPSPIIRAEAPAGQPKKATPAPVVARPRVVAAPRPVAPRQRPPVARANHQHRTCQYINGEPAGAASRWCGAPVLRGSSYCPGHHARCWHVPERREAA